MNKLYQAVLLGLLLNVTQAAFDITKPSQSGTAFNKMAGNTQTIIDFKFNSVSSADYSTPNSPTFVTNALFRPTWLPAPSPSSTDTATTFSYLSAHSTSLPRQTHLSLDMLDLLLLQHLQCLNSAQDPITSMFTYLSLQQHPQTYNSTLLISRQQKHP